MIKKLQIKIPPIFESLPDSTNITVRDLAQWTGLKERTITLRVRRGAYPQGERVFYPGHRMRISSHPVKPRLKWTLGQIREWNCRLVDKDR